MSSRASWSRYRLPAATLAWRPARLIEIQGRLRTDDQMRSNREPQVELSVEGRTIFRRRVAGWLPAMAAAILISMLTLAAGGVAVALFAGGEHESGLILLVLAAWMLVLADYVWRDCLAKRGWS